MIWIIIAVWAGLGLVGFCFMKNAVKIEGGDNVWLCFAHLIVGPFGAMLLLICEGRNCFGRKNKRAEVYWNESADQIMAGKKCLYDVAQHYVKHEIEERFDAIRQRFCRLERRFKEIQENWVTWRDKCNVVVHENDAEQKELRAEIKQQSAQLQCSAKTGGKHKMVFKEKIEGNPSITTMPVRGKYVFRCTCGLEITKTKEELTATEKQALTKLELI